MARWIRPFTDGDSSQRELLGGKGANLAEMTRLGLPIPPGFTITTDACRAYLDAGGIVPEGLWDALDVGVTGIEQQVGRRFGYAANPLLLSVRSGAAASFSRCRNGTWHTARLKTNAFPRTRPGATAKPVSLKSGRPPRSPRPRAR